MEARGNSQASNHRQHDLVACCGCCMITEDRIRQMQEVVERFEQVAQRLILPVLELQGSSSLPSRFKISCRSALNQDEPTHPLIFQLYIEGKLPESLYTGKKIQEQGALFTVFLCDPSSGRAVENEPLSSVKVKVGVLPGEFEAEDGGYWTEKEFNDNILPAREGKRPLLVGTCEFALRNGVAEIGDFEFTDNSKSTRSGKFRIAVMVVEGQCPGVRVGVAVSDAFKVKERRLESAQKHDPPFLDDDVWRLHHIAKKGPIHRRLAEKNIHKVKHFLQLYNTDKLLLDQILRVPNKARRKVIEQATSCVLPTETYKYRNTDMGIELKLNCVLNVLGVSYNGQYYESLETLDDFLKEKVEELRRHVYENQDQLVKIYDPPNQMAIGTHINQQRPSLSVLDPGTLLMEEQNPSLLQTTYSCYNSFENQYSYHQLTQQPSPLVFDANQTLSPSTIHELLTDDQPINLGPISPNLAQMPICSLQSKRRWLMIWVTVVVLWGLPKKRDPTATKKPKFT